MIPRRSSADSCAALRSDARRSPVARSRYPWIDAIFDSFDVTTPTASVALTTPTASVVIGAPLAVLGCSLGTSADRDAESKMEMGRRRLGWGEASPPSVFVLLSQNGNRVRRRQTTQSRSPTGEAVIATRKQDPCPQQAQDMEGPAGP